MEKLTPQGQLEEQLDKIDLCDRHNDKYLVILWWMRSTNICSIFLQDERQNVSVEFVVDNDKALHYFYHPFTHENAIFPYNREGYDDGA